MTPLRVLFLFLDGVGIGSDDPDRNPFLVARLPRLRGLFGGALPTLRAPALLGPDAAAFPIDARLGVSGTPQSGTGQTALLTGENAALVFGRHFGPWTPVPLRPLLEERSLLKRAADRSLETVFANAYPRSWSAGAARRPAAPPLAAQAAGLLTRHEEELAQGSAVASEITNDGWRRFLGYAQVPEVSAWEAGGNLSRLASAARLTFFAHYATDQAGHRGGLEGAVSALEKVDAFLGGVLDHLAPDTLLLLASDHGNVEDMTAGHSLNPALGVLKGPDAVTRSREIASLLDVTPAVLRWLE